MYGMTKKQHELVTFIDPFVAEHGYSPSFEEMKNAIGLASKSGVHRLLNGLEDRGVITRMANRSRSIALNLHHVDNMGAGL